MISKEKAGQGQKILGRDIKGTTGKRDRQDPWEVGLNRDRRDRRADPRNGAKPEREAKAETGEVEARTLTGHKT